MNRLSMNLLGNGLIEYIPHEWNQRIFVDSVYNKFSNSFIEVCKGSNLIILNGRFGQPSAQYTIYNVRNKSMFDIVFGDWWVYNHIKN